MSATDTRPATDTGTERYQPKRRGRSASDPRYADKARHPRATEFAIAASFLVSLVAIFLFGAAYWQNWAAKWLGFYFALIFLGMGVGVIAWGKYLMPQGPFVEDRHPLSTSEEDKSAFGEAFARGTDPIKRRSFLGKIFLGVNALLGVALILPIRSLLGKSTPGPEQFTSPWTAGSHLVTINGRRVSVNDLDVGGSLTVFPEGYVGSAVGVTILIRPGYAGTDYVTRPDRASWGPEGYVAFSKVCTHAGCPVGLYLQEYQQLLCPCHQSIFDVTTGATQVFGPAPRPLPQLPLAVDSRGYLYAQGPYDEPIGPGFWSRGALWKGKNS